MAWATADRRRLDPGNRGLANALVPHVEPGTAPRPRRGVRGEGRDGSRSRRQGVVSQHGGAVAQASAAAGGDRHRRPAGYATAAATGERATIRGARYRKAPASVHEAGGSGAFPLTGDERPGTSFGATMSGPTR